MDAAQRELSDQIDYATQRLLDDARSIPEADLRAPSLLPGWTRAHVLAHVARNADAMRNLLIGARSGQDRTAYASAQAREADIERGAEMTAKDLMADLADSAMALRTIVKQLPDEAWQVRVRILDSAPFPAAELLTRRLVEVELHHCDLAVGYSSADWPAAFAAMELTDPMRSQRRDRLRYPPPSPQARSAFPGRPVAPWKPGQRLPGSWLGTGDKGRTLPVPDLRTLQEFLAGSRVDAAVFALRPDYRAMLLAVDGLVPGPGDQTSDALLQAAEAAAREALRDRRVEQLPHVAAWREAYRAFGAKPQRTRNSLEALLRRAVSGLPRVNRLTDLYNAVSVLHQVPLGGEDLSRYAGAPRLVRATGKETFDTVADGIAVIEHPDPGEVVWCDDAGVTCRRLPT
jgi:uncharacterized protein (TIGR03083 family)